MAPANEMTRVLAIGDAFVPADVFREALQGLERADVRVTQIDDLFPVPLDEPTRISEYVGSPADVASVLGDAELLLVHAAPVTAAVLDAGPSLRVVGCARGGPVNVDVDAATERGLTVVRAPGRNVEAVAELTLLLMIALARKVRAAMDSVQESQLGASVIEGAPYLGRELGGRTLGVVGCGRVGTRVIEFARALGMTIVAYDPHVPDETIRAAGASPVPFDELLGRADVVSLHARATPDTENMFGAEQFASMREDALFVNAARETLVDEAALLGTLEAGRLGGAALDVMRPRSGGSRSPLLERPDTIVLPHIGGATREAGLNGVRILVDAVIQLRQGKSPVACLANHPPPVPANRAEAQP